uniref:Reverse transcriptase domain-containing protein n=1 Tax=Schistocephalus solidus TaxID=70667 RepID=A0A183TFC3_SCHSO
LMRWVKHFLNVLNCPFTISDDADLNLLPSLQETIKFMHFLERFTHMVSQIPYGMMVRITDNETVSEAFEVTNGVKQGCVLAPTRFSFMSSAMLMDAYRDGRSRIRIAYPMDEQLLINCGCISTRVYPQPTSTNCSLMTTVHPSNDSGGHAKEHTLSVTARITHQHG